MDIFWNSTGSFSDDIMFQDPAIDMLAMLLIANWDGLVDMFEGRGVMMARDPAFEDKYMRCIQLAYGLSGYDVAAVSDNANKHAFDSGRSNTVIAVLDNIPLAINPDWESVVEFRSDSRRFRSYRRLWSWADTSLSGLTAEEMKERIATQIDDYESALREHFSNVVAGSIRIVLDWRNLLPAGTSAFFGSPALTALTAGILVSGRVTAYLFEARALLEKRVRRRHKEIAVIHELQQSTTV